MRAAVPLRGTTRRQHDFNNFAQSIVLDRE